LGLLYSLANARTKCFFFFIFFFFVNRWNCIFQSVSIY
jgi:hypothetical protein